MNSILWVGQLFLAATFFYSGVCKALLSEQQLISRGQTGVVGLKAIFIHLLGVAEILGAVGIVLPWLLHTAPWLTPISALCFALVMAFAAPVHYRLREFRNVTFNLVVLLVSLFVAWGRFS